ncbi:hypothetical protein M422DRAFT_264972 [Sphaerobolus stellatus SS14]|uniref:Uncharacterized protein n=1 Tax=Sphaerobolus stellatus (strain SS14) TaxID=990650 RepID=A0A0C9V6Y4_SPHS4|nr:hypothetical protein M422DRAFT_264972 [Sphaerobolus stellatus SS14]
MSPRTPGGSDPGEDIDDVLAIKSGTDGVPLNVRVKAYMDLKQVCIPAYINDTLCVTVLQNVKAHLHFVLKGDLLWTPLDHEWPWLFSCMCPEEHSLEGEEDQ